MSQILTIYTDLTLLGPKSKTPEVELITEDLVKLEGETTERPLRDH